MDLLYALFVDPWQYAFMQRALLTGIVTALVCGLISCWLVLIGWSLMGDAISHAVLPGVVLSYILGVPFTVGALAFALLAVALIGGLRSSRAIKPDAAMGVVFTTLFALGTVLISVTPSQTNLSHILFGNLLGVSRADMWQVIVLGALVAVFAIAKRRDLTLFAFDPLHAQAIGLSPRVLGGSLLVSLAVTVVVSFQAVGVILSVAMLIVPGATARLLTNRIWSMLWISPLVALIATFVGIEASYLLDVSSGGMIGLTLGIMFAIIYLFAPGGLVARALRRSRGRSVRGAGNRG